MALTDNRISFCQKGWGNRYVVCMFACDYISHRGHRGMLCFSISFESIKIKNFPDLAQLMTLLPTFYMTATHNHMYVCMHFAPSGPSTSNLVKPTDKNVQEPGFMHH